MTAYIVRRFLQMPLVLFLVTITLFSIIRLIPGDPVYTLIGESESGLDDETVAALRDDLGLNDPIWLQYGHWLGDVVRGDLGRSSTNRSDVTEQLKKRIPVTLQLGVAALVVAIAIGIPAGTIAAVKRGSWIDALVTLLAMFGVAVPNFWLSMLAIWLFVVALHWLPATGFINVWDDPIGAARHLLLPSLVLGLTLAGSIMRYTRSSVLEVLNAEFVRTARAKGLQERVVIGRHALRNALLPVMTIVGLQLGTLLGGSVITESMFALPGVGRLAVEAINGRDYQTLQGVALFFATIVLLVNLLTDVAYAVVDPRIRFK